MNLLKNSTDANVTTDTPKSPLFMATGCIVTLICFPIYSIDVNKNLWTASKIEFICCQLIWWTCFSLYYWLCSSACYENSLSSLFLMLFELVSSGLHLCPGHISNWRSCTGNVSRDAWPPLCVRTVQPIQKLIHLLKCWFYYVFIALQE